MSELRWTLLIIAAVLLVALYLYGRWQEHRARDEAKLDDGDDSHARSAEVATARAGRQSRQAPLRIEPTMGPVPASDPPEVAIALDPQDPIDDDLTNNPAFASSLASAGGWVEDALLDLMLELRCVHAFDGVAALEARAQLDRLALPVPTHLTVWDSKVARWSSPDRFGFYSEMLIAVQLATRRARLEEIDATRFISAVQQIAVSIDADFDPPEVSHIVRRAAELDELCARFDVQITLTLEAQADAWSAGAVNAAATEAQMAQIEPGHWQRSDSQNRPLLSMTVPAPAPTRLAITLDVPRVSANPPPVSALFATASQIAVRLGARVVDDNGRTVESAAQSGIEPELEKLTAEMRAAGIEPGSRRALRLYTD